MGSNNKKLILFDIDGTLVSTGGAGTRSMNLAFKDIFGIENAFRGISMAGKTDPQIMREGLITHGLDHMDGNVEKMKEMYLTYLHTEIDNPLRYLMPGIREALSLLREMEVQPGLLTGNLEKGAQIKLTAFQIYDQFRGGAFGSDHEDRDRLLPVAIDKFAQLGVMFSPEDCIVIGDTPRDVRCAKIHGAYCIAVATGPYSREHLLRTDADLVLDSLEETEKFLGFLRSLR